MALFQHANVTLADAAFAVALLGGEQGIRALKEAHGDAFLTYYKYGDATFGRVEAFLNNCGGAEVVDGNLRGEKGITVQDIVAILFDRHGRYIPPRGLKAKVCDPNRNFHLVPPTITCVDQLARLNYAFEGNMKLPTAAEYEDRTSALIEQIRGTAGIANALNGVHLRLFMPQMEILDHGMLVQLLADAAKRSYEVHDFGGKHKRKLNNCRAGELKGQVTVIAGSRLDLLVKRLKVGPVFGIQFPNCLQGYSVRAQREVMETAPQGFVLSGPETLVTMAIYRETLARDFNTPCFRQAHLAG